jgi:hypothetical protein
MKNNFIAFLVLIIASVAGYFYFTKKSTSTTTDSVDDAVMATLTASKVATLTDAQIQAITPTQKSKLAPDVLAAISKREDVINTAIQNAEADKLALTYTDVIDLENQLAAAIARNSSQTLITQLKSKLASAKTLADDLQKEEKRKAGVKSDMMKITSSEIKSMSLEYLSSIDSDSEKWSFLSYQQKGAMSSRRLELELTAKAEAITPTMISKFSQDKLNEVNASPEFGYFLPAQKNAMITRQEVITADVAQKAMEARMASLTLADINKMTLIQLKAFTPIELETLKIVNRTVYNAISVKIAALQSQQENDDANTAFQITYKNLTDNQKENVISIAKDLAADMDWWQTDVHTWGYLAAAVWLNDAEFYYLIYSAYEYVANRQLLGHIEEQGNWSKCSKANKRDGKSGDDNVKMKDSLIFRIKNFPYKPV